MLKSLLLFRVQLLQSQGKYQHQPPRPFVLGSELAGRISDDSPIPDGCPFRAGDRVFGAAQGAFGEKVAVAWQALVPLPDNMTYDQGAGASTCIEFAVLEWGPTGRDRAVCYLADELRSIGRSRRVEAWFVLV